VLACRGGPPKVFGAELRVHGLDFHRNRDWYRFIPPQVQTGTGVKIKRSGSQNVVVETFLKVGFEDPKVIPTAFTHRIEQTVEATVSFVRIVQTIWKCQGDECDCIHGVLEKKVIDSVP